jgi:hypothetical protein
MHARFIVCAALLFGVAVWAPTAVAAKGATRGTQAAPRQQELRGRITRVDEAQREIVLDAGDATTQVRVAKDAKITIDGASAKLGDLKRGAEVRASLDSAGGDPQVVRIEAVGKSK